MTGETARPHVGACPLCEQGLVRVVRCPRCRHVSAFCDECEAIWTSPRHVRDTGPSGQHPRCPSCTQKVRRWTFLTARNLRNHHLDDLIAGESV